jgi:hypothetical protein
MPSSDDEQTARACQVFIDATVELLASQVDPQGMSVKEVVVAHLAKLGEEPTVRMIKVFNRANYSLINPLKIPAGGTFHNHSLAFMQQYLEEQVEICRKTKLASPEVLSS